MEQRPRLRVLVTDIAWPSTDVEEEILSRVGADIVLAETGEEPELLTLAPKADAILTTWARVPAAVIRAAERLQTIGNYGIGVDNIDLVEATALGVPVTNVPAYCLDEVAEHALAMIFAFGRQIIAYDEGIRAGAWETRLRTPLHRIRGGTLGVVGFGRIGRTVARSAVALGMRVIVCDPFVGDASIEDEGCEKRTLDELLEAADYVSLHVPLTPATEHLIGEAELRRMKRSAYLVNVSRGSLVDQAALVRALEERRIAGAGLDVFHPEPLPTSHPLFALPDVIATPHVAFYSEESLRDLQTSAAENVAAVLAGRRPRWVVNPEVLALPRWSHLR
jgi:D-3-phosphoglycerate dehydrogenase